MTFRSRVFTNMAIGAGGVLALIWIGPPLIILAAKFFNPGEEVAILPGLEARRDILSVVGAIWGAAVGACSTRLATDAKLPRLMLVLTSVVVSPIALFIASLAEAPAQSFADTAPEDALCLVGIVAGLAGLISGIAQFPELVEDGGEIRSPSPIDNVGQEQENYWKHKSSGESVDEKVCPRCGESMSMGETTFVCGPDHVIEWHCNNCDYRERDVYSG